MERVRRGRPLIDSIKALVLSTRRFIFRTDTIGRPEILPYAHRGRFRRAYLYIGVELRVAVVAKEFVLTHGRTAEELLMREIRTMSALRHPHVIELRGFSTFQSFGWLFFSEPSNGGLPQYLECAKPDLVVRLELIAQVANAVAYLHGLKPPLCHGNIKSASVFVNKEVEAVLGGFDFAARVDSPEEVQHGSIRWCSPEGLLGEAPRSTQSDIWSLGCLALEVVTEQVPYANADHLGTVVLHVLDGNLPTEAENPGVLPDLHSILQKCWERDAMARPTAMQCDESLSALAEKHKLLRLAGQNDLISSAPLEKPYARCHPLSGRLDIIPESKFKESKDVFRGRWSKPNGEVMDVVIKHLDIESKLRLDTDAPETVQQALHRAKHEVKVWRHMAHPHVLPLLGSKIDHPNQCLVSPLCSRGDLHAFMEANSDFEPLERLRLLTEIAEALAYVHSRGFCHGDLAPGNVLITQDYQAMLSDFGFSYRSSQKNITHPGTQGFQAPEAFDECKGGPKSDVFAFGGLCLFVMSGLEPYYQWRFNATLSRTVNGKLPMPEHHPRLPTNDPMWVLMRWCWRYEPGERPSMATVVIELRRLVNQRLFRVLPFSDIVDE